METPDAIGWVNGGESILVECKNSRTDYRADAKKPHRQFVKLGMGDLRYYMFPEGMLIPDDWDNCGWGYLAVNDKRVKVVKQSENFSSQCNHAAEITFLASSLRRVQLRIGNQRLSDFIHASNSPLFQERYSMPSQEKVHAVDCKCVKCEEYRQMIRDSMPNNE